MSLRSYPQGHRRLADATYEPTGDRLRQITMCLTLVTNLHAPCAVTSVMTR